MKSSTRRLPAVDTLVLRGGDRLGGWLPSTPGGRQAALLVCLLSTALIFLADVWTPRNAAEQMLYAAVLVGSLWTRRPGITLGLAGLTTVLVALGWVLSPVAGTSAWIAYLNRGLILALLGLVTGLVLWLHATLTAVQAEAARLADANATLAEANVRLEAAMARAQGELAQREATEAALRASEQQYRDLVQHANSVILRWKADGTITFFNEYAETFFGYRADEVVGQSATILLPKHSSTGEDLTPLAAAIPAHPERYATHVNENLCRDGRRVWMAWTNRPIYDAQGHLVEMVGVGSDITARMRAERAVAAQKAFLEGILEQAAEGIVVRDAEGRVLLANAVMQRRARRPLEGSPLAAAGAVWGRTTTLDGRDLPLAEWPVVRALAGETVTGVPLRRVAADGTPYTFLNSCAPIRDAAGAILGVVAIDVDITALQAAEERLRTTLAEREAALATNQTLLREVHHRVKNNLQMLCDLMYLQMEGLADEKKASVLRDTYGRIYAIARLHEQLYQSLASGQVQLPAYLSRLINGFGDLYATVPITLDAPSDDLPVDVDRAIHVGLIVNELVTNAVKHAFPDGRRGEIVLRLQRIGEQLVLQVRDNGKGLPDDLDLEQTKSLGLRIVRILAQRLKATVTIQTTHGTCVTLTFPLEAEAPVEPRPE